MSAQLDYDKLSAALLVAESRADQVYRALAKDKQTALAQRVYEAYRLLSDARVQTDIQALRAERRARVAT